MNANAVGKTLVFLQLCISMLCLSWAAGIYLLGMNWGWKEPRQELNYFVAAEIDKRTVWYKEAIKNRDMLYVAIKPAQQELREAEQAFAQNSVYYTRELKRLLSDPNEIEVKQISDAVLELDSPGKLIGKPVMAKVVDEIKHSFETYLEKLKKVQNECKAETGVTLKWIEKEKDVTMVLNGLDLAGKKTRTGLYELVEEEKKAQAQIKFEMQYLEPIWVNTSKEAEIFSGRKKLLLESLARWQKIQAK